MYGMVLAPSDPTLAWHEHLSMPAESRSDASRSPVAHVMNHVCGGVIGYPITPSTEFVETFEAEALEQAALARHGL